jgi:uncharacterized NAD-dependent epimerase/dehydratase family protein
MAKCWLRDRLEKLQTALGNTGIFAGFLGTAQMAVLQRKGHK